MTHFERAGERIAGDIVVNDVLIPFGNLSIWPDEELAAYGITRVDDPVVDPVPEIISDRQFYQGLALKGKITNQEALDAVKTGAIPAIFQSALSGMTGNDAFGAEMLLSGAIEFRRSYPLTLQLGQALGFSSADLDDFWRFAATL